MKNKTYKKMNKMEKLIIKMQTKIKIIQIIKMKMNLVMKMIIMMTMMKIMMMMLMKKNINNTFKMSNKDNNK
jgi:hypothetical protein